MSGRRGAVSAIVLAAGESSRMGRQKLLLPFAGTTVIECTVQNVLRSTVDEVLVVTGNQSEAVGALFRGKAVRVVHNPEYRSGMTSSIVSGVLAAAPGTRAVLVLPGDQPTVTTNTIDLLLRAYHDSTKGIVVPVYRGRTGHPAVFSLTYHDELMGLLDHGARELVYRHPGDVLKVEVESAGVTTDIDTLADYERLTGPGRD